MRITLKDCCAKHIVQRYRRALLAEAGTDCPELAREVLQFLESVLPDAWAMLSGEHPIHQVGVPRLSGPRNGTRNLLFAADWALDRVSRVLPTACRSCGSKFGLIILNGRSLDIYSLILSNIATEFDLANGGIWGDTSRPAANAHRLSHRTTSVVFEIIRSKSLHPFNPRIHICDGTNSSLFNKLILNGIAFLAAHEAAHAHAFASSVYENELETDQRAAAFLQHRANYLTTLQMSSAWQLRYPAEKPEPLVTLTLGIDCLLRYLQLERTVLRAHALARNPNRVSPNPEERVARIWPCAEAGAKLGFIQEFGEMKKAISCAWEDFARLLEEKMNAGKNAL